MSLEVDEVDKDGGDTAGPGAEESSTKLDRPDSRADTTVGSEGESERIFRPLSHLPCSLGRQERQDLPILTQEHRRHFAFGPLHKQQRDDAITLGWVIIIII